MGSTHFLSLSSNSLYHHLLLNPTKTLQNPNFSSKFLCSSSSRRNRSSDFDAFDFSPFEFEDEFGRSNRRKRRRREKRRNWLSDDDDDDDDDDEDDDEFGFWEESSTAVDWFFKILKAFGWMVPAILISTLLGTGSNSLVMAVVLPLGQTALSLVLEKLIGGPSSSPRFRRSSKSRSRSRSRPKRNPSYPRGPNPTNGDYQSWEAANNPSAKQSGKSSSIYGGWDELDQHVRSSNNFPKEQMQKVFLETVGRRKKGNVLELGTSAYFYYAIHREGNALLLPLALLSFFSYFWQRLEESDRTTRICERKCLERTYAQRFKMERQQVEWMQAREEERQHEREYVEEMKRFLEMYDHMFGQCVRLFSFLPFDVHHDRPPLL